MSRLIETIRLYNGRLSNLEYHQVRMDKAFREMILKKNKSVLEDYFKTIVVPQHGLYKCRLVYDDKRCNVEFVPYQFRPINSLKIIENNSIVYSHKFEDRTELNSLFNLRDKGDDVLIIKNNEVTDTSFSNIVFKQNDKWFTPKSCLLNGTMRQYLLEQKVISEIEIRLADIKQYEKFKLINSMLQFSADEMDVDKIIF